MPASAAVHVSFDSDLDSDQWEQVEDLLERFPDGGRVLPMLKSSFEEEGVDFENDVEPALGPTVEVVWLDFETRADGAHSFGTESVSNNAVALTRPDDEDKLRELAAKSDDPVVVDEVDGWSVIAETQALIDRFERELGNGRLAADAEFQAAAAELPDETLATIYVGGEGVRTKLQEALRGSPVPWGLGEIVAGAAALEAADDGFRLTGYLRSRGLPPEATDATGLLADVPAGAFLALEGRSSSLDASAIPPTPELDEFERQFGVSLSELLELFAGDSVFYARAGGLMPELTLLLEPTDVDEAKSRLDALLQRLPGERGEATVGDVRASTIRLGRFTLLYAAVGERLVVTTLVDGIRAQLEGGEKLVDEERFRSAAETAGVEADDVVLYGDLEQVVRLAEQFATTSGEGAIPPDVERNLEPLRSVVAAVSGEGDVATYELFLEIE